MLNQNFLLICVLSNDEHDCTFYICMRSDKLRRHERKMIRELRYQGLLHIEDCAFLKSQCVLADLCNHTGLEVNFHWPGFKRANQ